MDSPKQSAEDRQTIARLLLEQVTLTVEGNTDRVEVELRWTGGFLSRHVLSRPVQTYEQLSDYEAFVRRLNELRAENTRQEQPVRHVLCCHGAEKSWNCADFFLPFAFCLLPFFLPPL